MTMTDEGYPRVAAGLPEMDAAIAELGLQRHVLDLELYGYTVVPDVLSKEDIQLLADELTRLAEEDGGQSVDVRGGTSHKDRTQEVCLLFSRGGEVMRKQIVEPSVLTLMRYLLGDNCLLSSFTGYVKGPGHCELGIHSDTAYVPDPLPPYAQLANVNLLLTDYTPEAGCLTMVPGSHRYCHRPREGVGGFEAVPIIAPAGSAVVFHGNTWHGALPRTDDGVRLTLSILYARMYMRCQENYQDAIPGQSLAELPPDQLRLVAPAMPTGWRTLDEMRAMTALRKERGRIWYRTRGQHV